MDYVRYIFILPNLAATFLNIAAIYCIWRMKGRRFAADLMVILALVVIWSLCQALLYLDIPLDTKKLVLKIQYIGVTMEIPSVLVYILRYIGYERFLNKASLALLFVVPVLTLILAWTNDNHHLIWSDIRIDSTGPFPLLAVGHGLMFWFWVIVGYLYMVVSMIFVITEIFISPRVYRNQYILLAIVLCIPWVFNIVYISRIFPSPQIDMTAVAFSVTGILLTIGFFVFKVQDIIPIARNEVFLSLQESIFVCDLNGRIVYANEFARESCPELSPNAIGSKLETYFAAYPKIVSALESRNDHEEISIGEGENGRIYEALISQLADKRGGNLGTLLRLHDITDRKKMEEQLHRLAITDPLTGAYNRRFFVDYAHKELLKAKRYQHELSMLMVDIDHFKSVNDLYGHDFGDFVIQSVVSRCLRILRETDCFSRIGGEEFCVLLPQTGLEAARITAQRVCSGMTREPFANEVRSIEVSVSIGIANLTADDTVETMMHRADVALYEAKAGGRNCYKG